MAKQIEVLLQNDVLKLGHMGDVVKVKPGYARNYLLPHGLAILANGAAKRQIEVLRQRAAVANEERAKEARTIKQKLDGKVVKVLAKVAHDNVLFGSVGIRDILKALLADGIQLDPRQVHLHENFKQLGRYQVEIGLHDQVSSQITLEVGNEDPNGMSLDEVLAAATASKKAEAEPVAAEKAEEA